MTDRTPSTQGPMTLTVFFFESLSLITLFVCSFYSHSQHMKFSRLCHSAASSWSMWCCSPHPQQVQETSSVLDSKTSSQVMFISLITGNSIAQSQKIATLFFTFFYFFLAHDLAHNMLCLGGPARGRVCQLLFIVYKKRADRLP